MKNKIIQNALLINHTGEILVSASNHDYKERNIPNVDIIKYNKNMPRLYKLQDLIKLCFYSSVRYFMVDGGLDYIRQSANEKHEVTYLNLYENSTIEELADKLIWGTYGKDGKQPFKYVLLKNCETEHLQAILNIGDIGTLYSRTINYILNQRNEK